MKRKEAVQSDSFPVSLLELFCRSCYNDSGNEWNCLWKSFLQEESYMNLKKALPILALVLGLAGGVLHGLDLAYGYNQAGLPTDAPWLTIL